ncbi:hypothetical protein B2G71_06400 [Novosphingobium sp. PC22D]|nr:hypothetical protein B2G71_06400 [Novosphingobium sp. PC22D]
MSLFYSLMELVWESITQRRALRTVVIIIVNSCLVWIFAPVLASISKNVSLIEGVLYGWLVAFVILALLANHSHQPSVGPDVSELEQEKI